MTREDFKRFFQAALPPGAALVELVRYRRSDPEPAQKPRIRRVLGNYPDRGIIPTGLILGV
jgi:hypothetical protein